MIWCIKKNFFYFSYLDVNKQDIILYSTNDIILYLFILIILIFYKKYNK